MTGIVILEALRTPRGRGNAKGALAGVKPVDLLAVPLRALAERLRAAHGAAEAVFGCVTQTGEQGANIGKLGLIAAGYPDAVPALTVNRFCASGISAIRLAALAAAEADGLAVAGGVESMSRVPMASDRGPLTHDAEFQKAAALVPIGISADAVATLEGFSRADCDAYAAESQARAAAGEASGALVPVAGLVRDETPRPGVTAAGLAALPPAFAEMGERHGLDALMCRRLGLARIDHVHHAGNSPAMADAAAVVLLGTEAAAARAGLRPRARLLGMAELAADRALALTGAVDASRAALARAALGSAGIDLFEVNESFAALMLHYARHMDIPRARLNPNGGAIALGHPMGATGAILLGMALDELDRRFEGRRGGRALVAACGAAGLASAIVVERIA